MGHGVSFVLQVQTARMSQGVSYLLGVAFYNSADLVDEKAKVRCHSAAQGLFGFGLLERERRLQAFANRKGSSGTCFVLLCNLHKKTIRSFTYKCNPK